MRPGGAAKGGHLLSTVEDRWGGHLGFPYTAGLTFLRSVAVDMAGTTWHLEGQLSPCCVRQCVAA